MNWNFDTIPELYKEVEVLLKDGTTRKDMMIKSEYGSYKWYDCSYFGVLGWREITENKTNTKENKTMKKSRENRMKALKAANIETGKYFSVTLPEGLKPGSTINVTISEDGTPVVLNSALLNYIYLAYTWYTPNYANSIFTVVIMILFLIH